MEKPCKKIVDLYSSTRFCLTKLGLMDLYERSGLGKSGLEEALYLIFSNPERISLYEYSLRIDASVLLREDEYQLHDEDEIQEEITMFMEDLLSLFKKYSKMFPKSKPLYIGLEEPSTIVVGLVKVDKS